jgi:hypothetical protein
MGDLDIFPMLDLALKKNFCIRKSMSINFVTTKEEERVCP